MYILECGNSSMSIKLIIIKAIYEYYQQLLILHYRHSAVMVMYLYLLTHPYTVLFKNMGRREKFYTDSQLIKTHLSIGHKFIMSLSYVR